MKCYEFTRADLTRRRLSYALFYNNILISNAMFFLNVQCLNSCETKDFRIKRRIIFFILKILTRVIFIFRILNSNWIKLTRYRAYIFKKISKTVNFGNSKYYTLSCGSRNHQLLRMTWQCLYTSVYGVLASSIQAIRTTIYLWKQYFFFYLQVGFKQPYSICRVIIKLLFTFYFIPSRTISCINE